MTLACEIDLRDFEKFTQKLTEADRRIPQLADAAVQLTANEGTRFVKEKTPHITGNLRRGFQVHKLGEMVWRIYNYIVYAPFIETGERHDPRYGVVLRRAGPANMVAGSLTEIRERLAVNIGKMLDSAIFFMKG